MNKVKNTHHTSTGFAPSPSGKLFQTYSFVFPFSDRASYIEWRADWRREYAKHAQDIRDYKPSHHYLKPRARLLLQMRRASKIRAQECYLAAKAEKQAA